MGVGSTELLLITVLMVAVLAVPAVVLGRWLAGRLRSKVRRDLRGFGLARSSAREILYERYARGEIEREEYERVLQDLAG